MTLMRIGQGIQNIDFTLLITYYVSCLTFNNAFSNTLILYIACYETWAEIG